jgi:hypothetical protein
VRASEIARRRTEKKQAEAFFPLLIARCRSLRIAPGSRLLCRRSPTKSVSLAPPQHGGARSGAERRRRRRIHRAMREQPKKWLAAVLRGHWRLFAGDEGGEFGRADRQSAVNSALWSSPEDP